MADHNDATIIMKLYDLRREAGMRDARDKMTMQFNPTSWEEFAAVAMDFENPMNVAMRQVSSRSAQPSMISSMATLSVARTSLLRIRRASERDMWNASSGMTPRSRGSTQ